MPAGSTNFKPFNEALANLETDLAYASDAMRTGGIVSGRLPSNMLNKVLLQCANFVAALAGAMAAKGYTVEDGSAGTIDHDLTALTAVMSKVVTIADLTKTAVSSAYGIEILSWGVTGSTGFLIPGQGQLRGCTISRSVAGVYVISGLSGVFSSYFNGTVTLRLGGVATNVSCQFLPTSSDVAQIQLINPSSSLGEDHDFNLIIAGF